MRRELENSILKTKIQIKQRWIYDFLSKRGRVWASIA